MKNYVIVALACLAVGACSNEETFGTQVQARGDAFGSVATSWNEGDAMIRKGNDAMKKGQEQYEEGRSLIEKGDENMAEGRSLIEKGQQMKMGAETNYHQLRTAPYQGAVPQ